VTTYNVFACFHVCITSNHYNVYIVARLLIGSKADIEVCAYIISGHTFERRAVNKLFLLLLGYLGPFTALRGTNWGKT